MELVIDEYYSNHEETIQTGSAKYALVLGQYAKCNKAMVSQATFVTNYDVALEGFAYRGDLPNPIGFHPATSNAPPGDG